MSDATQERIDGPTPAGGVYAIAYFTDVNDQPVAKSKATQVKIFEYDAKGESINRTYGVIESATEDSV